MDDLTLDMYCPPPTSYKYWSCCPKKKTYEFDAFLEMPGCETSKWRPSHNNTAGESTQGFSVDFTLIKRRSSLSFRLSSIEHPMTF